MKTKERRKTIVVFSESPAEFQAKLNEAYEVAGNSLREVHYNDGAGLCCYVTYDETTYIPETLADEAHLRGEELKCGDCPYCEPPTDGRTKKRRCVYALYGYTRENSDACEVLYKHLITGKVHLREEASDEE